MLNLDSKTLPIMVYQIGKENTMSPNNTKTRSYHGKGVLPLDFYYKIPHSVNIDTDAQYENYT